LAADDKGVGVFLLRAAYADQGANGLPSCLSEQTIALRNAKLGAHDFDRYDEMTKMSFGGQALIIASKSDCYAVLQQIDLTSLTAIEVNAAAPKPALNAAGGDIEIHLDAPTGKLIGAVTVPLAEKMDMVFPKVSIALAPTSGVHDIYMVFKNPKAEGRSLMVVTGALFKN
jgi:cytochrome c